jgi:lipopolysaccharide transport system permease protein
MAVPTHISASRPGYVQSVDVTLGPWTEPSHASFARVWGEVLRTPGVLWRSRDLVGTCLGRDLSGRFRGTMLGWLWPLVQPALLLVVYGFVFAELLGVRMPGAAAELQASYGLYLFTGALVWSAFAESLTRATTSLVDGRHLIGKLTFPAEVLPLTPVLGGVVTLAFGTGVTLAVSAVTGLHPLPGAELAWVPVLFALGGLFTYGLALLCAAAHIHLRDTREVMACLLTVLMFATPIFWVPSVEVIPSIGPWLDWIQASPLYLWITGWRGVLMGGQPSEAFGMGVAECCARLAPWSVGSVLIGRAVFAALQRGFADEV